MNPFLYSIGKRLGWIGLGYSAIKSPRRLIVVLSTLMALAAMSCAEGSYPVDIFYEMHYHPSYRAQEPPRLLPAPQAVPVTGREIEIPIGTPLDELTNLPNPIPGQGIGRGSELFTINCAMCHGLSGKGDGPVLVTMIEKYGYQPNLDPDLTTVKVFPDGFLFAVISNRDLIITKSDKDKVMPKFQKLLTQEERWMLVNYIKSMPGY